MLEGGGKTGREGYVYILEGDHGYFKIGRTISPSSRIAQIEPRLPFKVSVKIFLWSPEHEKLESLLHEIFAAKRRNGEWFVLTEKDIAWLEQNPLPTRIKAYHAKLDLFGLDALLVKVESILTGIDQVATAGNSGWWEREPNAEYGANCLKLIRDVFEQAKHGNFPKE